MAAIQALAGEANFQPQVLRQSRAPPGPNQPRGRDVATSKSVISTLSGAGLAPVSAFRFRCRER